ncbi:MAG: carbohydrate-binding domain-containing protein [Clostridiales bacterium]|nr:carbohydrate-binding domain-containing protein [Clostridiales bacterium]
MKTNLTLVFSVLDRKNKKAPAFLKTTLLLLLSFALLVTAAACNPFDPRVADNPGEGGGAEIIIPKPDVPDAGDAPPATLPDVDEASLVGDVSDEDKAAADAVILLKGDTAEVSGAGAGNVTVTADKAYDAYDKSKDDGGAKTGEKITYGAVVEIAKSGTYILQGTLAKGFVAVSKKDLAVTLILNGVNIFAENYAALVCLKKSDVTVELAENSVNYLTDGGKGGDASDGSKYAYGYDNEEQPNAALLIRKDLTVRGAGKLTVNGGLNNGIGSRANLTIESGVIKVYAPNNALKGNDSITVSGGDLTLVSESDGVKTEGEDDGAGGVTGGEISVTGGELFITAVNDAVQAASSLAVSGAVMKIKTGGGADAAVTANSAKGLKAAADLTLDSGTFEIDSNDDALHSNGNLTVAGGVLTLRSGDDGIHADETVNIGGGQINISKSYEGVEGYNVNITGGSLRLNASDDGINIVGGKDASSMPANRPGVGGQRPGQSGGGFGGGAGGASSGGALTISGGEVCVNATGDGLDSNGGIVVTGGATVVFGPTSSGDAPIDYDGSFTMSGGVLIAMGSSGMAQQPGAASTQYTVLAKFGAVAANTLLNVSSANGTEVVTVTTVKSTQSLVVCSPLLQKGQYTISSGGSHSGTQNGLGIYTGGAYSAGSTLKTFTVSGIVTNV